MDKNFVTICYAQKISPTCLDDLYRFDCQAHITYENYDFEFDLPVLNEQAIAHILGTLDDKIELNQKMNQTLEETAKAIFKSWFVDFDPVRAKMEGCPTGLSEDISNLFPDELVTRRSGRSEVRGIYFWSTC